MSYIIKHASRSPIELTAMLHHPTLERVVRVYVSGCAIYLTRVEAKCLVEWLVKWCEPPKCSTCGKPIDDDPD